MINKPSIIIFFLLINHLLSTTIDMVSYALTSNIVPILVFGQCGPGTKCGSQFYEMQTAFRSEVFLSNRIKIYIVPGQSSTYV